jgi:diguanylate cyclase (GGDEF)-like protein
MNSRNDINILIVDDRPENLLVLESLLENMECNIIKATSGNQALGLLLEYDFALVLLDVQMPDMDGFETAELMRISSKTRFIPIIFVTAISKEQKCIFKGYEVGAVDYLFKPIEPIILQSKVRVFLDLYKQKKLIEEQAQLLKIKVKELSELQQANHRLENLSLSDGLTGISNRRSFDQYIDVIWKSFKRSDKPLSIIMADIDYFKAYNDNYGHIEGDACLIKVARCMVSSVKRPLDLVARYGGEEFCVILPETDSVNALLVAERIRENLKALRIPHEYSQASEFVTLSLGVATMLPGETFAIKEFIDNADKALYKAKSEGRDMVSIYAD